MNVFSTIETYGVVPVIAIDSVDDALPLADALIAGGLPVAEITFRTAAAADVIKKLKNERPEIIVGAGTILTKENLQLAIDCGASFGVAPGTNPDVLSKAGELGLPFIPGVATPSDVERGIVMGCRVLKLFPAEVVGGVSMIKALSGPYAHTGVKFMPTGGVTMANLESYLSQKTVAAVGGTWIATKDDIANGNWQAVTEKCIAAREVVRRVRG